MIVRLVLFSLYIFGILFCGMTFVKAQAFGTMCFPLGTLAKQAAQHGEIATLKFRDREYFVNFTMYINPKTRTFTLAGVADVNPSIECVAAIGGDFDFIPQKKKIKGLDS